MFLLMSHFAGCFLLVSTDTYETCLPWYIWNYGRGNTLKCWIDSDFLWLWIDENVKLNLLKFILQKGLMWWSFSEVTSIFESQLSILNTFSLLCLVLLSPASRSFYFLVDGYYDHWDIIVHRFKFLPHIWSWTIQYKTLSNSLPLKEIIGYHVVD